MAVREFVMTDTRHTLALPMVGLLLIGLAMSGCNRGPQGIRVTEGSGGANSGRDANATTAVQPIQQFDGAQVKAAIVGKTFQYTRPDGNGFVTYNPDGSFNYQDDTRGKGVGRWTVSNNQFCETFGPNAPQDCGEFKSTGDAFFAAKSRLVEMKV